MSVNEEEEHEAEVARLGVSPLVLPLRFVNEEFMATPDPYGSNDDLIGSATALQLQTPRDTPEGKSAGQSAELQIDAAPSSKEQVDVPGETVVEKDSSLSQEDRAKDMDPKEPVVVSDSSSE